MFWDRDGLRAASYDKQLALRQQGDKATGRGLFPDRVKWIALLPGAQYELVAGFTRLSRTGAPVGDLGPPPASLRCLSAARILGCRDCSAVRLPLGGLPRTTSRFSKLGNSSAMRRSTASGSHLNGRICVPREQRARRHAKRLSDGLRNHETNCGACHSTSGSGAHCRNRYRHRARRFGDTGRKRPIILPRCRDPGHDAPSPIAFIALAILSLRQGGRHLACRSAERCGLDGSGSTRGRRGRPRSRPWQHSFHLSCLSRLDVFLEFAIWLANQRTVRCETLALS